MSTVKSHDCRKCGSALEIDPDRQVYRSDHRGYSYEYESFDEVDVAQIAHSALVRGDFGPAGDAYSYILIKDPHDFTALKGQLLCACRWNSIRPVIHMSKVSITEDAPSLKAALSNCLPEHKEYFDRIVELIGIIREYRKTKNELKVLEAHKASELEIRQSLYGLQKENDTRFSHGLVHMRSHRTQKGYPVFDIVLILLIVTIAVATALGGWKILIGAVIIPIIYAIVYNIRQEVTDRNLEDEIRPHTEAIERLETEADSKIRESEKIKEEYMRRAKALIAMDIEISGAVK